MTKLEEALALVQAVEDAQELMGRYMCGWTNKSSDECEKEIAKARKDLIKFLKANLK